MQRPLLLVAVSMLLLGCSNFPNHRTPFAIVNPLNNTEIERAIVFKQAQQVASTGQANAAALKTFIDTGISYTSLLCSWYFEQLVFTKAHRDFAKRETNLVAGLTSTVLGLAKASTGSVAAAGALFSFGEASFDAYETSYIVTPELATLEKLVREKMKEEEVVIHKKINATSGAWPDRLETYAQAERLLNDYIFHCTVNGMRNLLAASIQIKTQELKDNTSALQRDVSTPPSVLPQK